MKKHVCTKLPPLHIPDIESHRRCLHCCAPLAAAVLCAALSPRCVVPPHALHAQRAVPCMPQVAQHPTGGPGCSCCLCCRCAGGGAARRSGRAGEYSVRSTLHHAAGRPDRAGGFAVRAVVQLRLPALLLLSTDGMSRGWGPSHGLMSTCACAGLHVLLYAAPCSLEPAGPTGTGFCGAALSWHNSNPVQHTHRKALPTPCSASGVLLLVAQVGDAVTFWQRQGLHRRAPRPQPG